MSKANPLLSLGSGELIGLSTCKPCDLSYRIRFGQALWVTLISFPAVLINVLPASQAALGVKDLIGLGIWASGFGLEILADSGEYGTQVLEGPADIEQRRAHGERPKRRRSTRRSSSHPVFGQSRGTPSESSITLPQPCGILESWLTQYSYLGEFALQLGPPVLAMSALSQGRARSLVWLSPIFTYVLLRYASGVPPLEKSAEKKWGSDPKWRKYVEETSVLVPLPGGLGKGKAA